MGDVRLPLIPASFFGMVLGLAGLGSGWRLAHQVWGLPAGVGEAVMGLAVLVWFVLVLLYAAKWMLAADKARAELDHAVQCCFAGLLGVATMLVAGGVLPYARGVATALFAAGVVYTLGFAVWRTGLLWHGERDTGATTPVLYLPAVAGSFVTGIVAAVLGYAEWGQLALGAGVFSWLAIESVLLHRLYSGATMPPALRPTLGIQLAPPAVCAVAYLAVTQGPPDMVVRILLGYGLLVDPGQQPFSPSYWAFSFGMTALANAPLAMLARGDTGVGAALAPVLFAAANLVVGLLAAGTVWLAARGRLGIEWIAPYAALPGGNRSTTP